MTCSPAPEAPAGDRGARSDVDSWANLPRCLSGECKENDGTDDYACKGSTTSTGYTCNCPGENKYDGEVKIEVTCGSS